MNLPDNELIHRIDDLCKTDIGFALYRLPWTDECTLVLQTKGEVVQLKDINELNGQKGFVIAPFAPSEAHPLVLVRPDVVATDWDAIRKTMFSSSENYVFFNEKHSFTDSNPATSLDAYREAFGRFIAPLRENTFQKLVLSRTDTCRLDKEFSPLRTFVKACNNYPRMMIYLCHTSATGTWIGTTPEILLSGKGDEWQTVALAGTMPMDGELMPQEWSKKNLEEQAMVANYIRRIVKAHGSKCVEKGPYTARAGQLVHLKSDFFFRLKKTDMLGHLLDELHPTPAVCGIPKAEAYHFITENEIHQRKYYTGFVGWIDPHEQTDVYVNLRCMEICGDTATLYAGGGILPSSEVMAEWEETNEKLKTIKHIIETPHND